MALRNLQVTSERLERMGRALSHRGPDNFSTVVVGNVGVAHNRLSILDLSAAGNQPFTDGRYVLAYNGEIYNYRELGADLKQKGHTFTGTSDTEVLFHYLRHYGVSDTLRAIRGMFAFSYYDRETGSLYLCRDRYGIKPLFWTYNSQGLFWGSEVKAIAAAIEIKPDPIRTLVAISGSGDQSNDYTVFKNVHHVPPGSYLTCLRDSEPTIQRYYSPLQDIDEAYYRELDGMSDAEILRTFGELMRKSVGRMLMSDVPVGVFASGGIDSSLIAAIAHSHNANISLFTSNVVGQYSELNDSRLLADTLRLPLFVSEFQPQSMLEDLALVTYHYECPLVKFTNSIPMARVAELARKQGVKPVLTGEGSDELFLGYPGILYQRYGRLLQLPVRMLDRIYEHIPLVKKYVQKTHSANINDFIAGLATGFERRLIAERGGYDAFQFLPEKAIPLHYKSVEMLTEHLVALLHRNDRVGMSHSIESRFPFLDEELVRFALNLPLRWKIRRVARIHNIKHPFWQDKAVVRVLAEELLPPKLCRKPKWGFVMYGFKYLRVDAEYFKGGYIADLLGLTGPVLEYMAETQDRYSVAKLVGVDVFGRIFDRGESLEDVTDRLLRYLKIDTQQGETNGQNHRLPNQVKSTR